MIYADHTDVDMNCGIGVVNNLSIGNTYSWQRPLAETVGRLTGTGYFIAGFVDNKDCHEAYAALLQLANIVFQSEVRINTNSGNEFFFCVFDRK